MEHGANQTRISQKSLPANARRITIPAAALGPWLAEIDDADELRVTLRALALLAEGVNRGGAPPSVALQDLTDDKFLAGSIGENAVTKGLAAALDRGTLIATLDRGEVRVFLSDNLCYSYFQRKSLEPIAANDLLGRHREINPNRNLPIAQPEQGRVNIFALYEEHIGPYGHSMAEQLKATESEYPPQWIEDAFAAATERKAASWNYIHAILRRWLHEGRYSGADLTTTLPGNQSHEYGKLGNDPAPDSRKTNLDDYRERYGRLPWEPDDGDTH